MVSMDWKLYQLMHTHTLSCYHNLKEGGKPICILPHEKVKD